MRRQPSEMSCYGGGGSASTSTTMYSTTMASSTNFSSSRCELPKLPQAADLEFDLRSLRAALRSAERIEESGYHSVLERSQHSLYGTGWMFNNDKHNDDDESGDDTWDGVMEVGNQRVKVNEMSDVLASRYAFLSGSRSPDGHPLLTFPDTRSQLSFDEYRLLITYILQIPSLEETNRGYVIVVDRRLDKWTAVRSLLLHLSSFFPSLVRVVFLLKPEGVLQRALEVGYRSVADGVPFKVIVCQNAAELRSFLPAECLTMDVGGHLKYNHLEWVQHRMDIERMKASAAVIAQSLSEFGRCLRDTELPNDAESTGRILQMQTAERDAIKEDFRISIRKGLHLLRHVRQQDTKPQHESLSPTRLHNVTAIERMLIQLEETEQSFDAFWTRHEKRLTQCLQLRRFEDQFRKLQASFAKHMIFLEEHRAIGDGPKKAEMLEQAHAEYCEHALEDVVEARGLREQGAELISAQDNLELAASLLPKCDELARMADALSGALERRSAVLRLSKTMHEQIAAANAWCSRGVDLLSNIPFETLPGGAALAFARIDEFLTEGNTIQLDSLDQTPSMNSLILLTTTETSTLLAQVSERINDIRRLSGARREALQRAAEREQRKPVQVVSPEKLIRKSSGASLGSSSSSRSPAKRSIEVLHDFQRDSMPTPCPPSSSSPPRTSTCPESPSRHSVESFVIAELITTEETYVRELLSIVEHYVDPFEASENASEIPSAVRGRGDIVFGKLRDLLEFHDRHLLADFHRSCNSPSLIAQCFVTHRQRFLALYHPYCQNKQGSEALRREHVDGCKFFLDCQRRAGHALPLGAYLLKPVQRITKYQLLLRELRRHCTETSRMEVDAALQTMLDLLAQLNAAMHQLHIAGFNGDLGRLGPLRVQTECDVFAFKRKAKQRSGGRSQRRFIFLFDGGILLCKKRSQPIAHAPEYYEHKLCIPTSSLGFSETSKTGVAGRFDLWDSHKPIEVFAIQPVDESVRGKWIQRLQRITGHVSPPGGVRPARPHSWTSTVSNDSNASTRSSSGGETSVSVDSAIDPNGNQTVAARAESPPSDQLDSPFEQRSDSDNNVASRSSTELITEKLQTEPPPTLPST